MNRIVKSTGLVLGGMFVAGLLFVLWASSGRLPEADLKRTETYAAEPIPAARDTLTVMTYNLGFLSGMTNNKPVVRSERLFTTNMDHALDLFRGIDPDVAALQEIDYGAARSFYVDQLDTLATRLGYPVAARTVNWDVRYLPFPYGRPAVHYGRVLSGQAVLSQYPVREHRRYVLPRPPLPFYEAAFYLDRLAQAVLLDVGGHPVVVLNVHLEAYDQSTREQQARVVRALYDSVARPGIPVFLLGDFNSELSARDDGTMAPLLDGTDLRPALQQKSDTTALLTYPAAHPTKKIDHILYRPGLVTPVTASIRCGASGPPPSDHCAVFLSAVLTSAPAEAPPVDSLRSLFPPPEALPRP